MGTGARIKRLREKKDINQRDFAKLIKISNSVLSRIESGERPIRDEEILAISKALNVSTDYLLGREDIEKTKENKEDNNKDIIPEEFTDPNEARAYIDRHQIFGSDGFDADRLDDEEILNFANALLEQMRMVSYKYRK